MAAKSSKGPYHSLPDGRIICVQACLLCRSVTAPATARRQSPACFLPSEHLLLGTARQEDRKCHPSSQISQVWVSLTCCSTIYLLLFPDREIKTRGTEEPCTKVSKQAQRDSLGCPKWAGMGTLASAACVLSHAYSKSHSGSLGTEWRLVG